MMALSEAVNAFSFSSDDGGGIVEITRVSGLLSNTIILLPVGSESMPKDMKALIQKDPQQLNFLDPLNLPKLSHKQLYCDIDLTVMNKSAEFLAFHWSFRCHRRSDPGTRHPHRAGRRMCRRQR